MSDFLVETKDGFTFDIKNTDLEDLDIVKNRDGSFHLIHHNKSYNISILKSSCDSKHYLLSVNGKDIELNIKDSLDQMLDKMGFANSKKQDSGEIKSPMPGLVLHIDVNVGQEIEKGDTLLVLEAMKMENLIKAHISGKVKSIDIKEGEAVSKNQILLVME